jgi:hypothetical protein
LNSLTSASSKRSYDHAIREFIDWYCSEPRLAFNRSVVTRYRIALEQHPYAPSTINLRLAAIRRLAYEASDCGLLSPDLAAGIRRVKGVRRLGVRVGNWLTAEEGKKLLGAETADTLRSRRNRALLSLLIGFTRAAKAENVAQPSLSQQIRKLEAELGAKLFDRFPRSARLNQFGRTFLFRAEAILRQVGEARTEIQEMAGAEKGKVVIGAIPTVTPYFLPPVLTSFTRQHPTIAVSVVEETTPILLERLHDGEH